MAEAGFVSFKDCEPDASVVQTVFRSVLYSNGIMRTAITYIYLQPWREYASNRFLGAPVVTTVIFVISQIPA